MHALVVDRVWEAELQKIDDSYRSNEALPLFPVRTREGKIGPPRKSDEEGSELDDDEMVRRDLVAGLLKMNLVNRLRYQLPFNFLYVVYSAHIFIGRI